MKTQTMVSNLINLILDQRTYKLFFQKFFNKILIPIIFFIFFGCESKAVKSIKINDDLTLHPLSKNKNGCTQFTLKSKSENPTIQIIYYVDKNGNYSASENKIKNCI